MENIVKLTNLLLPANLLETTDKAVKEGKAKSRDEFIAKALRKELAALKRAEIDAELAEMANDPEYQAEVLQLEIEPSLFGCALELRSAPGGPCVILVRLNVKFMSRFNTSANLIVVNSLTRSPDTADALLVN